MVYDVLFPLTGTKALTKLSRSGELLGSTPALPQIERQLAKYLAEVAAALLTSKDVPAPFTP